MQGSDASGRGVAVVPGRGAVGFLVAVVASRPPGAASRWPGAGTTTAGPPAPDGSPSTVYAVRPRVIRPLRTESRRTLPPGAGTPPRPGSGASPPGVGARPLPVTGVTAPAGAGGSMTVRRLPTLFLAGPIPCWSARRRSVRCRLARRRSVRRRPVCCRPVCTDPFAAGLRAADLLVCCLTSSFAGPLVGDGGPTVPATARAVWPCAPWPNGPFPPSDRPRTCAGRPVWPCAPPPTGRSRGRR